MKVLPTRCPSCNNQLMVKCLVCEHCRTEIQGEYELAALAKLSSDDQAFMLAFIKASGSLKEMARLLRLSYPTVRNRLDDIIERIKLAEKSEVNERKKKL